MQYSLYSAILSISYLLLFRTSGYFSELYKYSEKATSSALIKETEIEISPICIYIV